MKKNRRALRALGLLLALFALSACGKTEPSPEPIVPEVLQLERLTVELPQGSASAEGLLEAAGKLPELLRAALLEEGVEAGEITVTIGTSYAATGEALAAGNVQLAFLPPEAFALYGAGTRLLAASSAEGTGETQAGERSEILATASSYGKKLAQRSAQGKTLSFDELRNARWGILEAGNNAGNRYPALYLADHYAGNTLADLDSVTIYASYEELLRAAAEKTVDIVPLPARILTENAALWQRERSHSDDGGRSGFGQENGIFEDLRSLGETEPVYRAVALVPEDCGEALSSALFSALGRLSETAEGREMLARTGAERYAQVMPDALDGMKRALSLEGES